jgi:integrase
MKRKDKGSPNREVLVDLGVGTSQHIRLSQETRATRTGTKSQYIARYGKKFERSQKSWPCTTEGRAAAEAYVKQFDGNGVKHAPTPQALTTGDVWSRYLVSATHHLAPRSLKLYSDAWKEWQQHRGAESPAESFDHFDIERFRRVLEDRGLATATIRMTIQNIRGVYNWALHNDLISRNRWNTYKLKVAKNRRTKPRAEYRHTDALRIWQAFNPTLAGQWRPWVAVGLLLCFGFRQNEVLPLDWSWIDDDFIKIPSEFVKNGEAIERKLFPLVRRILKVAQDWRERLGYRGSYVLFTGQVEGRKHQSKKEFYSIQTLTNHIHKAEKRAGISPIKWRAGHGFRRGLVGDVADETSDTGLALQAIGDKDIRMANHYRVRRNDKIDIAIRERMDRIFPEADQHMIKGATMVQPTPKKRARRGSKQTGADSATP